MYASCAFVDDVAEEGCFHQTKKVQKIQSMLYLRLRIIILPCNKSINRSHRQFQRVPGKMLSMRFACRILEFFVEHFFGFAEVTGSNLISRLIDELINF